MPETYSQIQQQYPLSPRKFWKKMITRTTAIFFVCLVFGGIIGAVIATASEKPGSAVLTDTLLGFLVSFLFYLIVVFLPYAIYVNAYIKRYYYDLNQDFIKIKKGVFAPTEIHVQYAKIQDVYVDQDLLDRIMGLYDVHIASATQTSGMEAHIDGVDHEAAEGLKNLLLSKIRNPGTSSGPYPSAPTQTTNTTVNLTEKISSAEFPIQAIWLLSMIGKSAMSLIVVVIFIIGNSLIKSTATTSKNTLGTSIAAGFWVFWILAAAVVNVVYWAIWRANFYFEYQPEYILQKTQVLAKSEKHVPYRTIQNVSVSQGIIERVFGICTVTIENAAQNSSSKLTIPGLTLEKGNQLVALTNNLTSQIRSSSPTGL